MTSAGKRLRPYQKEDLLFYIQNPRCANLSAPGTGKTPSVCVYLYWLWRERGKRSAWVMPKSLLKKNRQEILNFTNFEDQDVLIFDGNPKQRNRLLENSKAKVWLMGFRRFADDWQALKRAHPDFDLLCVDEIHMGFGGAQSNQTKQMWAATDPINPDRFNRFLAMTGTLINGKLETAYPTIKVLEPSYYKDHDAFLNVHAVFDFWGGISGWRNHSKLQQILEKHAIRRTFRSVYGANQVITSVERVPMGKVQRRKYEEFRKFARLDVGSRFLCGQGIEAVEVLRLRQIMAHPENVTLPTEWNDKGKPVEFRDFNLLGKNETTGKDERLEVHLIDHRNSEEPLLIFAAFKKEVERIFELVSAKGLRVGKIHGGIPLKQRSKVDHDFRSGEVDVVVATLETASVGFNWGHVDHIIFVSLDYKDTNFIQARRRAERGSRNTPLRVTVLEYEASIDQAIFAIVERKSNDAHLVDEEQTKIVLSAQAGAHSKDGAKSPSKSWSKYEDVTTEVNSKIRSQQNSQVASRTEYEAASQAEADAIARVTAFNNILRSVLDAQGN